MANEAAFHELEGHRSSGALTITYPEIVLTPQAVTFGVRAVNNRRTSQNTHSGPPWRMIEIEDAEVSENIDNNEGEFRLVLVNFFFSKDIENLRSYNSQIKFFVLLMP